MNLQRQITAVLFGLLMVLPAVPAWAQQNVRVVGTVRDETNAIALPGTPVEVVGTSQVVYTDVDGRYVLTVPPGTHQIKVVLDGYQEKLVNITTGEERTITADIGIVMSRFAETVNVTGQAVDAETSSAAAQLVERRNADVITDNLGAQEMRANGDSDAAAALSRVTGMSVVDNQYVFVRGLGERYSNTTLAGASIPTTEPDKKVVPLDLFPAGLIDSIQVAKSYSPDKSAEFAGGLVQIIPLKLPSRPVFDVSYGVNFYSTATGEPILKSPLNGNDIWGFDNGARELPATFPDSKIVRHGISRRMSATRRNRSRPTGAHWKTCGRRSTMTVCPARTGASRRETPTGSWDLSPVPRIRTRSNTPRRTGNSCAWPAVLERTSNSTK